MVSILPQLLHHPIAAVVTMYARSRGECPESIFRLMMRRKHNVVTAIKSHEPDVEESNDQWEAECPQYRDGPETRSNFTERGCDCGLEGKEASL